MSTSESTAPIDQSSLVLPTPGQMVGDFHRTFGLPIAGLQTIPEESVRELRNNLIIEEVDEFADAVDQGDHIEMADAVADMTYVAHGTALVYGIHLDLLVSNQTVRPEVFGYIEGERSADETSVQVLSHLVSAHVRASRHRSISAMSAALTAIVVEAYRIAFVHGYDLDALVAEVHESNMSKLDEDGNPLYRSDGKVMKGPQFFTPNVGLIIGYPTA